MHNIIRGLSRLPLWHFVWIAIVLSELFTLGSNSILSLVWWGTISADLLTIGSIDAFVVALLVSPIIIFCIKRYGELATLNQSLKNEVFERRRTEEALLSSESRSRALLEAIPDMIFRLDREGVFLDYKADFNDLHVQNVTTVIGLRNHDVNPPDFADLIDMQISTTLQTGRVQTFDYRLSVPGGGEREYEARMAPTGRDDVTVIVRDITERRKAEEDLFAAKAFSQSIIDSSPDCIKVLDLEGRLKYMSPGGLCSLGIDDFQRFQDAKCETLWSDSDLPAVLSALALARAGEKARFEGYCPTVAGEPKWWDVTFAPILDAKGDCIRILAVSRDITVRKRAEEEKSRLETGLRHAQKLQAVGTLASGVAHEFNNLLATIVGFSEMIQDAAVGREDILADNAEIIKASERGRDLVKNILSFTRKAEPQTRPLNLNTEIRNSKEMLAQLLPRTVSIETRLAPDLKRASMSASHLNQILINLITNACHAMPDGGRVVIKTENISVDQIVCLTCGEMFSGDHVLLNVADTGHGMDAETVHRVFEPFFSTKEVGSGTGLGLSVVQGLVKSYGGHIMCRSERGKGATFKIFLPVFQLDEVPLVAEGVARPAVAGGTETILLVDDEEPLRNLAQRYFSDMGYRVHPAGSGEEALEIYRQHPGQIDLVVLDLGMAGMGGHKCLEEILAINPRAKVVIASGYTTDGQDQQALSEGADAFVGKPFKKAELLATVRSVLDKK